MSEFELSLKSLIQAVSDELMDSQMERIGKGLPAVFKVEEFNIEVSFVVTEKKSVGGGFDVKIIKADTSVNYDSSSIHKISIKMKGDTSDDIPLTPILPRTD